MKLMNVLILAFFATFSGSAFAQSQSDSGPTSSMTRTPTARAYGYVRDGQVDRSRSSRNLQVRQVGVGHYCLRVRGLSRTEVLPVISPDFSFTDCLQTFPKIISSMNSGCEQDEFGVLNFCTDELPTAKDLAFTVIFP